MTQNETSIISDHLDKTGMREGDIIHLSPLVGKKTRFMLNRTCIDFVSDGLEGKVKANYLKILPCLKNESYHVRLSLEESIGKNNAHKKRYIIEVLEGPAINLNGCLVFRSYLEENDVFEIGLNRLEVKRKRAELDFNPQKKLVQKHIKVVRSSLAILLEGETGTGKSTLAKIIHEESGLFGRFVHLNLSSFSNNLIESELFGHEKGAFTGAYVQKKGAFKEANGGTLFLDEIDSLPLELQVKLLLFLDNQKVRSVGGHSESKVNVRVIFSSGTDLKNLVGKGEMRRDFYFRISQGHKIKLQSIRDDLNKVEKYCMLFSINNNISVSANLVEFYKTLPWPGNYRQLKGHLDRKLVLSKSTKLDFDYIDEELIGQSSELMVIEKEYSTLQEVKSAYAAKVFFETGQNYTQAAKKLSISARSLKGLVENYKPLIKSQPNRVY
jgi:DNA-binding NtrC family response regulator